MQFVRQGPDVPERLLQAHEDGRVVFFCGAGISYPARLPGFEGLVKKLYADLALAPDAVQQAAIKAKQFDTTIGLLEGSLVGGRETVRRSLAKILTPDLSATNALSTHEALLTLSKSRDGHTRLITTNFDRLFEEVIEEQSLEIERFQAPLLPVPKNRWDGLVYLHGLLSTVPTASQLDRLVISSGDFGLAYLTERWAARFISELFRNYTVCFVGYSINDPVLRYMMDALAADSLLGESPPEMFAFGSYSKGKEAACTNEWKSKNVTPILYREFKYHAYLHKTIRAWAETYRDGVRGKERIVVECAIAQPLGGTKQDDFVGRLLWALSDPGGIPAKRFAELNPVPSLDWLQPLSEPRFRHVDLCRFGVPPTAKADDALAFSMTHRPAPYDLAPRMCMADEGGSGGRRWDAVMSQLARWIIRHLNNPALLLWLVKRGGKLNRNLVREIKNRLDELHKLELQGKTEELERIRADAPNAIPNTSMCTLWRLLLAGRVKPWGLVFNAHSWHERFQREGLTTVLRLELREALTPLLELDEPYGGLTLRAKCDGSTRIDDLVRWELVLTTEYAHTISRQLLQGDRWAAALPELLSDFSALLRDALDLMHELGSAGDRNDLSYLHQPSISQHTQNRNNHEWTVLIDLTRDAWSAMAHQSPERAALTAQSWWHEPYPLFRRLAFFAAAQGDLIASRRALDWLLADDHWWLWSIQTQREAIRLLVALTPRLEPAMLTELEQAVLAGPPRNLFNDDMDPQRWTEIVDRDVWLYLIKIVETGAALSAAGNERLAALCRQYPWHLEADQRDEFPCWAGDGDLGRTAIDTPHRRRELVLWLKDHPKIEYQYGDHWQQRCRENFPATASALCVLANENYWPMDRWHEALQAWCEENLTKISWRYIAPVLINAPDEVLQTRPQIVSRWLQAIASNFNDHEAYFFNLVDRVLRMDLPDTVDTNEPVMLALNHPVGQITDALLQWWFRRSPEDGKGLPETIKPTFTRLCNTENVQFRNGRVMLAANTVSLFRVDQDWTMRNLLANFNWQRSSAEARAAWSGLLGSPRLYRPLMALLKPAFFDTANHYEELGEYGKQYAALLSFAALDPGDTFAIAELASATRALPPQGLQDTAQTLASTLESAGDRRADFWLNRVVPYFNRIWPKTRDRRSPAIAERLGRLCIAAQDQFPDALALLDDWLQPVNQPDFLVHRFHKAELCGRFPEQALKFLSLVVSEQTQWPPTDLRACLDTIRIVEPHLEAEQDFERLMTLLRLHGGG